MPRLRHIVTHPVEPASWVGFALLAVAAAATGCGDDPVPRVPVDAGPDLGVDGGLDAGPNDTGPSEPLTEFAFDFSTVDRSTLVPGDHAWNRTGTLRARPSPSVPPAVEVSGTFMPADGTPVTLEATPLDDGQSITGPAELTVARAGEDLRLGGTLAVGTYTLQFVATYGEDRVEETLTLDTYREEQLEPPSGASNRFGAPLAVSGDLAFVGEPEPGARAVHVYARSGDGWTFEETLPVPGDGDDLAIALAPDRAVVGTRDRIQILEPGSTGWEVRLDVEGPGNPVRLAVQGDTAVVGEPERDQLVGGTPTARAGRVTVYSRSGDGVWSETAALTAPDIIEGGRFGSAVAVDGSALFVGAASDLALGDGVDAVYVYQRNGPGWRRVQTLGFESDEAQFTGFGEALALDGDLLLVGAPRDEGDGAREGGSVVVFERTEGVWEARQFLGGDEPLGVDFGASVAMDGDLAVVGGPGLLSGAAAGRIEVFRRVAGFWRLEVRFGSKQARPGLGASVGIAGGSVFAGAEDPAGAPFAARYGPLD